MDEHACLLNSSKHLKTLSAALAGSTAVCDLRADNVSHTPRDQARTFAKQFVRVLPCKAPELDAALEYPSGGGISDATETPGVAAMSLCSLGLVEADSSVAVNVQTRAKGAERVVVAAVESVHPTYAKNDFGDDLIVTRIWVRISEVMKGKGIAPGEAMEIDVEGGTVGDVTLRVSDMPSVAPGEKAVLFLTRNRSGRVVPHMRGLGILKLDKSNKVLGTDVTLNELRPLLRGN